MNFKQLTRHTHKHKVGTFTLAACHTVNMGENRYEYTRVLEKPEGDHF
jgi:hypothetical protein